MAQDEDGSKFLCGSMARSSRADWIHSRLWGHVDKGVSSAGNDFIANDHEVHYDCAIVAQVCYCIILYCAALYYTYRTFPYS